MKSWDMYAFYFTFILFPLTLITCFICCTHIAAAHCSAAYCMRCVRCGGCDRRHSPQFFVRIYRVIACVRTQETILAVLKAIESLSGLVVFLFRFFFFSFFPGGSPSPLLIVMKSILYVAFPLYLYEKFLGSRFPCATTALLAIHLLVVWTLAAM